MPPSGAEVHISVQELVQLLAKDIAREVADQLKETEILPLAGRVAELEQRLARCQSAHQDAETAVEDDTRLTVARWKGALDALWKVGIVLWVVVQVYLKLKHPQKGA